MKLIKKIKEKEVIDDSDKHHKILFDLGILDDMEDWEMYQKQESKYLELLEEIGIENYCNYLGYVRQK